jgi:hypothetical protein
MVKLTASRDLAGTRRFAPKVGNIVPRSVKTVKEVGFSSVLRGWAQSAAQSGNQSSLLTLII